MDRGERPKLDQETPTASSVPEPSTPQAEEKQSSQVERVLSYLRHRYCAHGDELGPWIEFQLAEGEFEEIERRVAENEDLWGFVDDKVRYNYFPCVKRIVFRSPYDKAEMFAGPLGGIIRERKNAIAQGDGAAAAFARTYIKSGPKHSPDLWVHYDAVNPGIVFEITYLQKRRRIKQLAWDYIQQSRAKVRLVISVDIEYGERNSSREATISMWRPGMHFEPGKVVFRPVKTVVNQLFRTAQGTPATKNPGLTFRLSDFACPPVSDTPKPSPTENSGISIPWRGISDILPLPPSTENPEITISCSELCDLLAQAERFAERFAEAERETQRSPTPEGHVWKRRTRSPRPKGCEADVPSEWCRYRP